ncbi:MAG: transposase [Deltaproteobacteria bacterium]|nr:transposase [Deltaproteobacteria bacterium]
MGRDSIENQCVELLRMIRWPEGVKCPKCRSGPVIKVGHIRVFPERKRYYCSHCRYTFSDTSMTVFHGSRLSLHKWFDAIILWTKGSSAMDIKNKLHVTYKTAWRIKYLLEKNPLAYQISQKLLRES